MSTRCTGRRHDDCGSSAWRAPTCDSRWTSASYTADVRSRLDSFRNCSRCLVRRIRASEGKCAHS
eukprot:4438071-Pleurochrysis_carterae.AAC.1